MLYLAALAAVVVAAAYVLWKVLQKQRKQAGITGWVLSQDLDGRSKKVYRDKKARISSKPDVVTADRVIEFKSCAVDSKARWVDIMQLAMQMKTAGKKLGELRYSNKRFIFKWDDMNIRFALRHALAIAEKMRWHLWSRIVPPANPSERKCAICKFGAECPDSLAR